MSNYPSLDPITGLQDDQALLLESFTAPSSQPGEANALPTPPNHAISELDPETGLASQGAVLEQLSLGMASGLSETAPEITAMSPEGQNFTGYLFFNWPPPPPGGGGWW